MILDTLKLFSISRKSIGNGDSTRRLALGVSMGMIIGLIPKESLLPYLFFVFLMITTANLLCAVASGFVFTWVGYLMDGFTHKLGGLVLTNDHLESTWAWLYELPLLPWTRFNNTVVLGSLLTAIVLFVPVYLASHWFFTRYGDALHRRVSGNWIYRWLVAPTAPVAQMETPVASNPNHSTTREAA